MRASLRRRSPPAAALRWAETSLGRGFRVVAVRPLRGGGGWHLNHLLDIAEPRGGHRRLVLRRWSPAALRHDPDCTPERESEVLARLGPTPVPAPRVIASDPSGEACGDPALLVQALPGARPGGGFPVEPLARVLAEVHRVDPAGLPGFRRYHAPAAAPPAWLPPSPAWDRVLDAARSEPAGRGVLAHRDFHPGNTLWADGDVTGLVDWSQACAAPASADVAHMRWNLAVVRGPRVADLFERAYESITGRAHDPRWDALSLVDALPDLGPLGAARRLRLGRYAESVAARL